MNRREWNFYSVTSCLSFQSSFSSRKFSSKSTDGIFLSEFSPDRTLSKSYEQVYNLFRYKLLFKVISRLRKCSLVACPSWLYPLAVNRDTIVSPVPRLPFPWSVDNLPNYTWKTDQSLTLSFPFISLTSLNSCSNISPLNVVILLLYIDWQIF